MGRGAERRQWRMKRSGSVVSKGEIPPLQGGITTIANLTEQAIAQRDLVRVQYRPQKKSHPLRVVFLCLAHPGLSPASRRCETSMGQTREASPQWGVPKASDSSLLARKGERSPLQGLRATIERTEHWFESNCHRHSEALVDQGLHFFALHPGVYCPGVSLTI